MNFNSIRFKYSAAFSSVAVIMIITGLVSFNLINILKHSLLEFSQQFNPAVSAVINADRDLYQARVAEINTLVDASTLSDQRVDYEENAQQAYDRMQTYMNLLTHYPDIIQKLNGFDSAFNAWKSASSKVFDLVEQDNLDMAIRQSNEASKQAFGALRDFYDIAGEAADNKGIEVNGKVIADVSQHSREVILFLLVTVILALGLGLYAPRALSLALHRLKKEMQNINSGNGDLTRRVNSIRKDEIGLVANELDILMNTMLLLMRDIEAQSKMVSTNVEQMESGASGVQKTSQQQLESVEMIVTAVNEMSVAIKEVAEQAQFTAGEINKVNDLSKEGKAITMSATEQIKDVSTTVGLAANAMVELAESSNNIASVLDVIRGIAEQTNLLALNAAIEAARAGEQGRGFAVVADEVRSLASKTQQSTDDIQKMIEALQKGVKDAVNAIQQGQSSVTTSVEKSDSTQEALNKIVEAALRVSDAATQIATSTEQQSQVAEDVNANLVTLADLGRNSFDHASQNKERAAIVSDAAKKLSHSIKGFKLYD